MDRMNAAMWDERYQGSDYAYGLDPNAFLQAHTEAPGAGRRALVPGDGEGRNGVWLASRGFKVTTLDLSQHGVDKASRLAKARGLPINAVCADALSWEWPQTHFDLIALIYLHLVAPDRRRLHAMASAALRPGGRIVLEAFRPEQIERQKSGARGGPRDVSLLYSVEDLREDFSALDVQELGPAEVDLSEGALHVGPSAVVRMVASAR